MLSFVYAVFLAPCALTSVVFPLYSDSDGFAVVNTAEGDDLGLRRMCLESVSRTFSPTHEGTRIVNSSITLPSESGSINHNYPHLNRVTSLLNPQGYSDTLGIGPSGDFQLAVDSVGVIRSHHGTSGFLILNATQDVFTQRYCRSDSVMFVPLFASSQNERQSLFGSVSIDGGDSRGTPIVSELQIFSFGNLLDIPSRWMTSISTTIMPYRIPNHPGRLTFGNCRTVRENLPPVNLVISGLSDSMWPVGTLTLLPEDYTREMDGEGDTCELLMSGNCFVNTVFFNPIMLQDLIMRIQTNGLTFCDPV